MTAVAEGEIAPVKTPQPPYYAVIFTSVRAPGGDAEYNQAAKRMSELAAQQEGFLGMEHAEGEDGARVTVCYWQSAEAVRKWRENAEHREAQKQGKDKWYLRYVVRVCRVEREYGGGF